MSATIPPRIRIADQDDLDPSALVDGTYLRRDGDRWVGGVPAGGGGGGGSPLVSETPVGTINGSNRVFTLSAPPAVLLLYKNGLLQRAGAGNDFVRSGATITFEAGDAVPLPGDVLSAVYQA